MPVTTTVSDVLFTACFCIGPPPRGGPSLFPPLNFLAVLPPRPLGGRGLGGGGYWGEKLLKSCERREARRADRLFNLILLRLTFARP